MLHNFRSLLFWDLTRVLHPYAVLSTIKTDVHYNFCSGVDPHWVCAVSSRSRTPSSAQEEQPTFTFSFKLTRSISVPIMIHTFNPPFLPFHGFCSAPISEDRWDTRTAHTLRIFHSILRPTGHSTTGAQNMLIQASLQPAVQTLCKFGMQLWCLRTLTSNLYNFEKERASKSALNYASRELYAFKNVIH